MKPTLEDLEEIDKQATNEAKRLRLCRENNICPECGAKIIKKKIIRFFKNDNRLVCEKNINHYNNDDNWYISF